MPPSFTDFAGLWIPLCNARLIRGDRPTPFTVAGERIVAFRDDEGRARALLDRCPHRGVALSLGKVEHGTITCPFHGWRFGHNGHCLHVPWNPDARREKLGATSLPLRESGGLVWLYTGLAANGEPNVPQALLRDDLHLTSQSYLWNAHWTRVMENMLDAPHLPFVHAGTIGKHLRAPSQGSMDMVWEPQDHGADIVTLRPGEPARTNIRYHYPNTMEMIIDPGGRLLRLLATCTPAGPGQTQLTIHTLRNFARSHLLDPVFTRMNARVAAEDRPIIESSHPAEVPPPSHEVSVATDAPTLAFRKIWFTQIKDRAGSEPEV